MRPATRIRFRDSVLLRGDDRFATMPDPTPRRDALEDALDALPADVRAEIERQWAHVPGGPWCYFGMLRAAKALRDGVTDQVEQLIEALMSMAMELDRLTHASAEMLIIRRINPANGGYARADAEQRRIAERDAEIVAAWKRLPETRPKRDREARLSADHGWSRSTIQRALKRAGPAVT
jgi:hypothetical protein